MWYRVFGRGEAVVELADLLGRLHGLGLAVVGHFRGDDLGWTGGELVLTADATPVYLERYLPAAEDLRDELNAWAAWLETADYSPHHTALMEHVIGTKQLFTLRRPIDHADENRLDALCVGVCQFLAARTEGVYQIDNQGFFRPDGELLLMEY